MKKKVHLLFVFGLFSMQSAIAEEKQAKQPSQWKSGVASVVITPEKEIWMAGYAARKKPSDGVVQDLYAKALALEDPSGERFVIVTMDLIGVLRGVHDSVARKVGEGFKLPPAHLLLNASHTHCGPEYRPRNGREKEANDYRAKLEKSIVKVVGEALDNLDTANLSFARARGGFAMNRRKNYSLGAGDPLAKRAPAFDGPVDHEVPVLWITDAKGDTKSILFTYACHSTTLSLAEHHGRTLAYSVIAAAPVAGSRPVTGGLRAASEDVELTRSNGKPSHNHPVQVARIGDQICLVALGSEMTVDYSLRLKREIDSQLVWVAGYSNDYSGYVPSRRVAQEGGYEASNQYTLDVEDRIIDKAHELLGRLNAAKESKGQSE